MSTALGYLFLLLPVAAVVWIVWNYRRKTGAKDAKSREREATLVGLAHSAGKPPRPAAAVAPTQPAAPAPAPPAATATRRDRYLSQPETLIYYLLRSGMPGYEVFPRVGLASVVNMAAAHSGPAPSITHDLDFVVCDKGMRVVAAIQLAGRLAAPHKARVEQSLAAAGIKVVTIDPKALPRREQLSVLILGQAG